MPVWGELFTDPVMQGLEPNPALMALIPVMQAAGCRRVLDAGCGVGRHLRPLLQAGFQVWGADCDTQVLHLLKGRLGDLTIPGAGPYLIHADLNRLPFAPGVFDLAVSVNVINHGDAAAFRDYCRELDRILKTGGHLFVYISPWEFAEMVRLPRTRELEPGTLVHHFPTPEELRQQFPRYKLHRWETVRAPIPFMGNMELPQLIFWGEKLKQ